MKKRISGIRNGFLSGIAIIVLLYSSPTLGQTIDVEVGDLNASDQVTIDEMTKVTRMHLGYDPVQGIADYNGDGEIMINEIIMALNCFLETGSCQVVSIAQSSPPTISELRVIPSTLPVLFLHYHYPDLSLKTSQNSLLLLLYYRYLYKKHPIC